MSQIRVDFVNQFVAHYRQPVMTCLAHDPGLRIRSIAAAAPMQGAIPSADLEGAGLDTVTTPPCRTLVGRLAWQNGVVSNALTSRADVIVYTGDVAFCSTWLAAVITRLRGRRVLMWTHGWTHRDAGPARLVRTSFYRLAHRLLVYGHDAVAFGRADGYRGHIDVVGNSTSTHVGRSRPATRSPGPQRWLVISRLIASRQIEVVLEQMHRLRAEGRMVTLDIVGDGPERARLTALAEELQLPVNFHGEAYDPQVTGAFLENADILLSPGHVGLAAIHAMSHGTPVATHDRVDQQMPEHEAVVDGVTGVRFGWGDFGAMADRVWDFVATSEPQQVADACLEEVSRAWTPQRHAERIGAAIRASTAQPAWPGLPRVRASRGRRGRTTRTSDGR